MNIISNAKKAYEDRKAKKLHKKLIEKKAFQEKKAVETIDEMKKRIRKPQAIQIDYNKLAAQAGDVQYKIVCQQKELEQINIQLNKFNQEFYESQQVWAEELKAERIAAEKAQAEALAKQQTAVAPVDVTAGTVQADPQEKDHEATF